jgi:hypothetical protein
MSMPRANRTAKGTVLTLDERRAKRELRREKQREDNIGRAAKMHAARLRMNPENPGEGRLKQSLFVGCSGWR